MLGFAFAVVLALSRLVIAAPTISFPINSQVPPVAEASEFFLFQFSESTFTSTAGDITYTLSGAPSWLQVNSANRTLLGTPSSSDVGSPSFDLVASDSAGSTDMNVTLVVTKDAGPQVGEAILPQLAKIGPTSSPDSLLLYPLQAFTITFDAETFTGTSASTMYYATSGNNTPLPPWITFSEQNLEFTGTSPSLVSATSYPQIYPIRLMASDVVGFASATATFELVVGYDILDFNVSYQSFAVQRGAYFQTPSLLDELILNDSSANSTDIDDVTSDAPSWLTLHTQNISLSGVPPTDATTQNVTVSVTDIYGDVANTTLNLDFSATTLFSSNFSTVNATLGKPFNYSIGDAVSNPSGINITVDLGSAASWLTYNESNLTLTGTVPTDAATGIQNVQVTASSGDLSQTETLPIDLIRSSSSATSTSKAAKTTSSTSTSSQSSQESSFATNPAVPGKVSNNHNRRDLAIVLGVLIPVILLLLLLLLILCCLRRRKRQRDLETLSQKQISRPIQEEQEAAVYTEISADGELLEKERTKTPEPAPRIELPWAPDSFRKSRARWSKRSGQQDSPIVGSSWGGLIEPSPPVPARSSKRSSRASSKSKGGNRVSKDLNPFGRKDSALNYSRKRMPFRSTQPRTMQDIHSSKRSSRPMSLLSSRSSGIPSRLSGMGHGSGGFGPPGYLQVRESWQNPRTSIQPSELSRMDSVDLENFPRPPGESRENSTLRGSEYGPKTSLRLVSSNSLQRSSLSEERQRYVRDRARDRLESAPRFSSAWSMRRPSSRDSRGIMERMRSPALSSSIYPDDAHHNRNTWRTYSKSSSVGGYKRPETIASEDEEMLYEEPRRPPPLMLSDRVSYSSGQFNSAESATDSNWEDEEDLEESIGPDGTRRWQVSASNSPLGSPLERPLDFGEAGMGSRSNRPSTSRGYPPPLRVATSGRRWRLGERSGKRPVSVTEGDLQRSQGSQRGNLAFV